MKNSLYQQSTIIAIIAFLLIAATGCKKSQDVAPTGQAPVLTTTVVSDIGKTSATCGGNITSEGSSAISFRGVCWSTHPSPTTADSKSLASSANSTFTAPLTSLTDLTTYYVRAFATNSVGTTYGNELSFTALGIGDVYQGGIIAYFLKPGDAGYDESKLHGIIAAKADLGSVYHWYKNAYILTGASSNALGMGSSNTALIIAQQGNVAGEVVYAANACTNYTVDGYHDWYLPSYFDFVKLQESTAPLYLAGDYWTSTEFNKMSAALVDASNGGFYSVDKSKVYAVRPVRSF